MITVLTIPDTHTEPGQSLWRFSAAGEVLVERRPDYLLIMGDFLSMGSLSHWDSKKPLLMEGRRYKEEINTGNRALDALLAPLQDLQTWQRRNRKKIYDPKKAFFLGNHEDWADRWILQNPIMEGYLDVTKDLFLEERGFTVVPYTEEIVLEGVHFMHAPINGNGKALSGENAVKRAATLTSESLVFAHLHRAESVNCTRIGNGDIFHVLSIGCFFEHDPVYEKGVLDKKWRGLHMLNIFKPGRFDKEEISLDRLRTEFFKEDRASET